MRFADKRSLGTSYCVVFFGTAVAVLCASISLVGCGDDTADVDAGEDLTVDGTGGDQGVDVNVEPGQVTFDRDEYGTPFIYASDLPSGAFGLGYAVAETHASAQVRWYLMAMGELSAHLGAGVGNANVVSDRISLALRIHETTQELYPTLDSDFREVIEAYADGVNRYLDEHRASEELSWIRDFQINGAIIVTASRFDDLNRQLRTATIEMGRYGQTECPGYVWEDDSRASNVWAVTTPLTSAGEVILQGDPHTPWVLDPIEDLANAGFLKLEAHLMIDGARIGGGFPLWDPTIGPGYTDYLAFSGTHSGADIADVYHLERTGATSYLHGQEERDITLRDFDIAVLDDGSDPPTFTHVTVTVPYTDIGPVACLDQSGRSAECTAENTEAFALVLPHLNVVGSIATRYALMTASSFDQALEELDNQNAVEGNFVMAGRDGDIVYIYGARIPARQPEVCYFLPLEASDTATLPAFDEEGHLVVAPVEDHPVIRNPSTGYLVNNNQPPQLSTAGIVGAELPNHNGLFNPETEGLGSYRQRIVREYFDSASPGSVTPEASRNLAMSDEVVPWPSFLAILNEVIAVHPELLTDEATSAAVTALRDWDGIASVNSTAVLIFEGWVARLDRIVGAGRIAYEEPPAAGELTADQLEAAYHMLAGPIGAETDYCEVGVIPYLTDIALPGNPDAEGALVPWGSVHQLLLPGESLDAARPLSGADRFIKTLHMSNASIQCPDFGMGASDSGSSFMMQVTFSPDPHVFLVRPMGNLLDSTASNYGAMTDLYASAGFREVLVNGPGTDATTLDTD